MQQEPLKEKDKANKSLRLLLLNYILLLLIINIIITIIIIIIIIITIIMSTVSFHAQLDAGIICL